jgi:hypothetical protein
MTRSGTQSEVFIRGYIRVDVCVDGEDPDGVAKCTNRHGWLAVHKSDPNHLATPNPTARPQSSCSPQTANGQPVTANR